MKTQKKIIIPIYGYKLTIIIFDDWNEIAEICDGIQPCNAFTKYRYGESLVAIDSHSQSSIVHEAEHVKNIIWEHIGYTPQINNDEVDAYLLTYICQKITEVFNRHTSE